MQGILLCLSLLVPFVLADDNWDNFTNNLATDLAPLITLFGERLTKQFLSESISLLDNIIFALSPLGVLTAVVSVIRVCGSSSLRAFIGRAQEGPSEAESELLPCVSESTAELFNDGGISRVFGRPKIVEVIVWQHDDPVTKKSTSRIGTLRNALCEGAWTQVDKGTELSVEKMHDELPELEIPNLSLNKGIKRRGQGWFYCAAILGTALQLGVMIYAALTVFVYPETFKKDGKAVAGYAFPFYIIGTTFLFVGMFFCAFIIERSSREYYFKPERASKIYWLQPGNQNVGDQVFKSFLATKEGTGGKMTKKLQYIKSTRDSQFEGQYTQIYLTLIFTMLGFIVQFVGLRGLHASVILAQLGSTFVMAIIRTCLRTERMAPSENKLVEKREITSYKRQELDFFTFYLENVESFHLLSPLHNSSDLSTRQPGTSSLAKKLIRTRIRLAELTSSQNRGLSVPWDDIPIRQTAQNLAETIEKTMDVMSGWGVEFGRVFKFTLPFECNAHSRQGSESSSEIYSICLLQGGDTLRWRMDANELEAVLGLWIWSLYKSDPDWCQPGLSRLVGLSKLDASKEETDLYFYKWIFRQTEATMVSSQMVQSSSQLFGLHSKVVSDDMDILVVNTVNDLETMAAQDIYIHFLREAFTFMKELGGEVDVIPGPHQSFLASSSHVDELVRSFEECSLGSREDALMCIIPTLKFRGLLPDLAADSINIRVRTEKYVENNQWQCAFLLIRWLCQRSDTSEFERSVYELGYLCRRAMLEGDEDGRAEGFKQTCDLLRSDIRAHFFEKQRCQRPRYWMNSQTCQDWWATFSKQLGWIVWRISVHTASLHWVQPRLEILNVPRTLPQSTNVGSSAGDSERGIQALEQWLTYTDDDVGFDRELPAYDDQLGYEWAWHNGYTVLLYFFLVRWTELSAKIPSLGHKAYVFSASNHSDWAMEVLHRHDIDIDTEDIRSYSPLVDRIFVRDLAAVKKLLDHGAAVNGNGGRNMMGPLEVAAGEGYDEIVELLLRYGASVESGRITFSALYLASNSDKFDTVRLLLSHGANIDPIGPRGVTPLISAVMDGRVQMIDLLLQNGANINFADSDGHTSVMLAAKFSNVDTLRLLLAKGANTKLRDSSGLTALDIAKKSTSTKAREALEAAGCT